MTYLEAAKAVLAEERGPLHYKEIARRATKKKLIVPKGSNAASSMATSLYGAVRHANDSDEPAVFQAVGRGKFELVKQVTSVAPDVGILEHNQHVQDELLDFLKEMHPRQLELIVTQLLDAIGFEAGATKYSGDGGIDVDATLTVGGVTRVRTAVQVKRWKTKNVAASTVRELRGGLLTDQRGLVITTAGFTKDARREAQQDGKTPISLIDGKRLVELLVKHQIGVRRTQVPLLQLNVEELVVEEGGDSGEKSATLWPLPGGHKNYFETAIAFIAEIGTNEPTISEMTQWVLDNYEKVTKKTVVKSYLRAALYSIGLLHFDGERVVLTEEGKQFDSDRSSEYLLSLLRSNVLGVAEVLDFLGKGPATEDEIFRHLVEKLDLTWETPQQTRYRLQWLMACEVAEKTKKLWRLADAR
jgi:restriction endonuclease Mrr